ncbi:GyrI-like domain-containing protein [Granulicella arctica]|uniref:Putative transcriptional regulator YdeE n=1 Tax=Granulicella arctica TaxID=940613 RepID=A0A7Y9TI97_9BACT|nr:effector binding domain-containing protein [Granulicella arctica]NYF81354.1 putative transcriptional regulator YdeE [Granulicella arctica]
MSYEILEERAFTVAGIFARVSNATPELIGDLWRRFLTMGGAQAIEGRRNDSVYCIYCEYEGDFNAPYTVVIGCAVDGDVRVAKGMKKVQIAAGRFAVLRATGELPMGVFEAWSEAWATPLDRLYDADFDRYGVDGVVTVHVGVR